jgi:hypothetical protein
MQKKSFKFAPVLLLTALALSTLASCVSTMQPGQISLPDLPPALTENPPEFRLLTLQKQPHLTPPPASPGESRP